MNRSQDRINSPELTKRKSQGLGSYNYLSSALSPTNKNKLAKSVFSKEKVLNEKYLKVIEGI